MREELSEQLKQKSIDGFLNCIERFNSQREQGRIDAVLILLGHACEMLLKSALIRDGANIHSGKHTTLSLMDCISEFMPNGRIPILSEERIIALRIINSFRNHAQHLHISIPEEMLFYCASHGLQIFKIVMDSIFKEKPSAFMPRRVLSLAETSPLDIVNIVTKGAADIMHSLYKDKGSATEKIRGLATVENAIGGKEIIPSNGQIDKLFLKFSQNVGDGIDVIFPLIASTKKASKVLEIPISEVKEGGKPVTIVPDGDPSAERIIYKDKQIPGEDFYPFLMKDIQPKIGVNQLEARALGYYLGLRKNPKYHRLNRYKSDLYSHEAFREMQKAADRFKQDQSYQDKVRAAYKKRPKTKKK